MGILIRIVIIAVAAYLAAMFLTGVTIADAKTAVLVAIVLALLNAFVKPILIFLTLPITILTMGLFLLVINIIIIYAADYIVPGFSVSGWLPALLFGLIVAIITAILDAII